ncbi:hypothetical protein LTR37_014679 [Vermiconidia calcicola]|uniref:Uncharacterized protein n=1 Tax=Vermiconidia calcicola TaxID=1690605 RepID=A0ACC3MSX8_9PEZI|nr:hypothetical protein LTR37_014679 [Vermiconidia calcicola]
MPTYLLHGFRWPRPLVRVHIILQNIDDAAAEWLVAPKTTLALLKNFNQLYPECMEYLPRLRFVEQYDPNDNSASATSQPYAYVADMVEEVKLGVEIDDVRGRGLNNEQWTAIMELRDKLAPDEKVGWYIVVCGDEERLMPPSTESTSSVSAGGGGETPHRLSESPSAQREISFEDNKPPTPPKAEVKEPKGVKKLFSNASLRLGRKKSRDPVTNREASQSRSRLKKQPPYASYDAGPPPIPRATPSPGGAQQTNGEAAAFSFGNGDGGSSKPSSTDPSVGTPSNDQLPEAAHYPRIRNNGTNPSSPVVLTDGDNLPEFETKLKYRRSSVVPDYRHSMYPGELEHANNANMPVLTAGYTGTGSSQRNSEVPPVFSQKPVTAKPKSSSRRNSEAPVRAQTNGHAPRVSDASANGRRRSVSVESNRNGVYSYPPARSGAVSPLTYRSSSPVGARNGAVSPIAVRSSSPNLRSPLSRDSNTLAALQGQQTPAQQKANARRQAQNLSLDTQVATVAQQQQNGAEDIPDEESEEIISLSPAARAPATRFKRRSTLLSNSSSNLHLDQQVTGPTLDTVLENGDGKSPAVSQSVRPEDLVAVNLENAFDRL